MDGLLKIILSPEFLAALLGAVAGAGGGVGFLTARFQAKAERERKREELENMFGTGQRVIYRHFLLHLERHPDPRPVTKEEAEQLGLDEGTPEDWHKRFQWERGKVLVSSGRRVFGLVIKYDFSDEAVIGDAALRESLVNAMHMELFPRLYTDEERAALPTDHPKEPKPLEAPPEGGKGPA